MAVRIQGADVRTLLEEIGDAIRSGDIDTWKIDKDGDLTHSPDQWRHKAWFRPKIKDDELVFNILAPRGKTLTRFVYGVYHGRLIEMLLNHFDTKFKRAFASALPERGDIIRPLS